MIRKIYTMLRSLLWNPPAVQVAALCHRLGDAGPEVLLVSSLDTRRWIIPKGWPMDGKSLAQAAEIEAWEEAGVKGQISLKPMGYFHYDKRQKGGVNRRCRVAVFPLLVETLADEFPEANRRDRKWFTTDIASQKVAEPELQAILQRFSV
jgi:8-oxo-dGTP pyrophosphatase MutT (NUDIX family)